MNALLLETTLHPPRSRQGIVVRPRLGDLLSEGTASKLTLLSAPAGFGKSTLVGAAMSLLAFLGLRYPVQLLPLLIFESAWKLIWLAAVGVPTLVASDVDAELGRVLFSVSLVVVILAVTPWDHVWNRCVKAAGDPWR